MKLPVLLLLITTTSFAQDSFYANKDVQRLSPEAFALQPESRTFVSETNTKKEAEAFLSLIKADINLVENIKNFPALSWENKERVLRAVFALEVEALNIKAPELVIDTTTIKGEAYIDFDTAKNPGPGKVILNPQAISKDANPYAGLMLLIHETRHSAQIQKAFDPTSAMNEALAKGYRAAFEAQKELSAKITSFSDFLTLNNEYEAFSFGNFVVGRLTEWKADTLDMGTFASQYNSDETLKIDLSDLFKNLEQGQIKDSVLDEFNRLEKVQYDLLTK